MQTSPFCEPYSHLQRHSEKVFFCIGRRLRRGAVMDFFTCRCEVGFKHKMNHDYYGPRSAQYWNLGRRLQGSNAPSVVPS